MKKIFSLFAAVLFAGSMMAQAFDHGMYVPATATVEAASEVGTTASVDPVTGDLTINLAGPHTSWGDWGNQIKLSTGVTNLDPAKSYEIGFKAVASTNDCPASHVKIFDDNELFHSATEVYTTAVKDFSVVVRGGASNGIIVWSFTWAPAQTVTISDIYIRESAVTYTTLAETYQKAATDTVVLDDFEVVYVNGGYCYIKDVTASGLIFKNGGYGLVAGDKVAKGLEAKIKIFNGLYELDPITAKADLNVTPGTPAQPVNATAAPTAADNKYMLYKNVTFLKDSLGATATADRTVLGVFGKDTITFYNTFPIPAVVFEAGKTYDVVGFNTIYKTTLQVAVASIEEHQGIVDECAGEHGLYNPATATINGTYFGPGWSEAAGAGCYAEMSNGSILIHFEAGMDAMWNGQVFVDPGFAFTAGKMYHYEFDVESAGKVCMTVKVNDNDADAFFVQPVYDQNIGGGTFHFETDSVIANNRPATTGKGPLVFGFGWTDGNQDVIIKCIKIVEIGDAPEAIDEVADRVKAVKVIENGRVVIIKNGVRYNALGAQL